MWFSTLLICTFLLAVISAQADEQSVTANAIGAKGASGGTASINLMW
jgi:hypothetical protein